MHPPKYEIEIRVKVTPSMCTRMNAVMVQKDYNQAEFTRQAIREFLEKHEAEVVSAFRNQCETDD
jgi:hypothetical protein